MSKSSGNFGLPIGLMKTPLSENMGTNKLKNKNLNQNSKKFLLNLVMDIDMKTNGSSFSSFPNESKNFYSQDKTNEMAEKQFADAEFIKSMQKALKEAIDENEQVRISYF